MAKHHVRRKAKVIVVEDDHRSCCCGLWWWRLCWARVCGNPAKDKEILEDLGDLSLDLAAHDIPGVVAASVELVDDIEDLQIPSPIISKKKP